MQGWDGFYLLIYPKNNNVTIFTSQIAGSETFYITWLYLLNYLSWLLDVDVFSSRFDCDIRFKNLCPIPLFSDNKLCSNQISDITIRNTISQTNLKKKQTIYSIYDHYPFKHYSGFYFKISKTGNCSEQLKVKGHHLDLCSWNDPVNAIFMF